MQYRRTAIALVAAAATTLAAVAPASAAWRGRHWGAAGAGFAAGALIGGALAAPHYRYGYGYGPYYGPYAYGGAYAAVPTYSSDDAYCSRRFKSYDPSSGTYLGYDGERHPCP
jgi:MFS family permease